MNNSHYLALGVASFLAAASLAALVSSRLRKEKRSKMLKKYHGSCHCKAIEFRCTAPEHLIVWECNCSVCAMRRNDHFIVPEAQFELLKGADKIKEYRFNTNTARHMFCSVCGIQPFYRPRSNPDGYGISFSCILKDQVESHEIKKFDGQNWEGFINKSGIVGLSKPQ